MMGRSVPTVLLFRGKPAVFVDQLKPLLNEDTFNIAL